MTTYITTLKDTLGNNYIGLKFSKEVIDPYLEKLLEIVGEEEFETLTSNQEKRDGGEHHMTLINVSNYNRLAKEMGMANFVNSLEKVFSYEIDDLELKGIGNITDDRRGNTTYYIVCESDKLDAVRTRYNLPKRDFHITLGFDRKDVFNQPKNIVKWVI